MNTKIFRSMSYGVYIVSTMDGERPTGCTANSAMQITSSLPRSRSASTMITIPISALKSMAYFLCPFWQKIRKRH